MRSGGPEAKTNAAEKAKREAAEQARATPSWGGMKHDEACTYRCLNHDESSPKPFWHLL